MKNLFTSFFLFLFLVHINEASSQIIINHKIDSIVNLISIQSLSKMNKELSGDTIAIVGGIPQIVYSRYYLSPGKVKATQYIFEKLQSFGYTPLYQVRDSTCVNVYAEKIGTKYPGRKYVVCAHYDDILWPINPGIYDTLYGADDNASGVCAVLEIARLLKNFNSDYTLVFITFDKEEVGTYGSECYADSAYIKGDTILGALNIDMIAYNSSNNKQVSVSTDTNSMRLANDLIDCASKYLIDLIITKNINGYGSDHIRFWERNFKALNLEEKTSNPYYHTLNDKFSAFNLSYFLNCVKVSTAAFMTWATDSYVTLLHTPMQSGQDTSTKTAVLTIIPGNNTIRIGTGANSPRIYYKFDNGQFVYKNAFEVTGNTYKFTIPGRPAGSKISYYLALQDSIGWTSITLPSGGSGVNPPGTTPPATPFTYYIWNTFNSCGYNTKPINDLEWTEDTIRITQQGIVRDVDVTLNLNHGNDGDLLIRLQKSNNNTTLSQNSGNGGQNFTNTVFDDSATVPISQGTPPFTGRFKPHGLLSNFNNLQLAGDWILKIYDLNTGNSGTLLNWCLKFTTENQIGVSNLNSNIPDDFMLYQNYPNPFNGRTVIRYSLPKNSNVIIKIYDILGKEIALLVNEFQKAGQYEITCNANLELTSGVYFYKIIAGNFTDVKKMLMIK
jgi:subtilisin-like proprotein convertase family protein